MFLGKMSFDFDVNDRFLLMLAAELLEKHAETVTETPEEAQWARKRAAYFRRLFTER